MSGWSPIWEDEWTSVNDDFSLFDNLYELWDSMGEIYRVALQQETNFPPGNKEWELAFVGVGDSGTATGGSSTTLEDTSKSWTPGQFDDGYIITITSGTGASQKRLVLSNDGTSVTVAAWSVAPDDTSTYSIDRTSSSYGTIGSVTDNGDGTITVMDASSPLAILRDLAGVKRFAGASGGATFNGTKLISTAPGAYDLVLFVDDFDPRKIARAHIIDTAGSVEPGSAQGFIVQNDGLLILNNGGLDDFTGHHYSVIESGGTDYSGTDTWADRSITPPVEIVANGEVPILLSSTASSSSTTAYVIDTVFNFDPRFVAASGVFDGYTSVLIGHLSQPISTHTNTPSAKLLLGSSFATSTASQPYTVISSTTTSLTLPGNPFTEDQLVDTPCDLIVQCEYGTLDVWNRLPITGNTTNKLEFDAAPAAPRGRWFIVPQDSYFTPRAFDNPTYPFRFYTGLMDNRFSHGHTAGTGDSALYAGSLLLVPSTATQSITLLIEDLINPDAGFVEQDDNPYDNDIYIDIVSIEESFGSDAYISRQFYKCLRAIQATIDTIAPFFVVNFSPIDSTHSVSVTPADPAMLQRAIGGDYQEFTLTVDPDSGTTTLSGDFDFPDGETELAVQATLFDHLGLIKQSFPAEVTHTDDGDTISAGVYTFIAANPDAEIDQLGDDGSVIGITRGWQYTENRMVGLIYDRSYYIPQMRIADDTGDEEGLAITPGEDGVDWEGDDNHDPTPGTYETRTADTNFMCFDGTGAKVFGRAFTDGTIAIYMGDNQMDPTTDDEGTIVEGEYVPADPTTVFRDFGVVANNLRLDVALTVNKRNAKQWQRPTVGGTVTSVDAGGLSFTDSSASLWSGVPRATYSATFTGSLSDSTSAGYPNTWLARFNDGQQFTDMVLQVEMDHAAHPGVFTKRRITTHTTPPTTFTPNTSFGGTTTGKTYKLEEPGMVSSGPGIKNYFKGHECWITSAADGSVHKFLTAAHDNTTVFYTSIGDSYVIQPGDTWQMVFFIPGDLVQWDADNNRWKTPDDPNLLQPDTVDKYGRLPPYADPQSPMKQLYLARNALYFTPIPCDFDNLGENSYKYIQTGVIKVNDSDVGAGYGWETSKGTATTNWDESFDDSGMPTTPPSSGQPPVIGTIMDAGGDNVFPDGIGQFSSYAYLVGNAWQSPRFDLMNRHIVVMVFAGPVYYGFNSGSIPSTHWTINVDAFPYIGSTILGSDPDVNAVDGDGNPIKYNTIYSMYDDGLQVISGGNGASISPLVWTTIYDQATTDVSFEIKIGDDSFAQPSFPDSNPELAVFTPSPPVGVNGKIFATNKTATIYYKYAVVDWRSLFRYKSPE